jgi:hypothetical protein
VRLARLHLSAAERRWEDWVLVRRNRSDPMDLASSVVFAQAGTALRTLARVAGARWRLEQSFELAKGEVGLDEYAVRRSRRLVSPHDAGAVRTGLPGGPARTTERAAGGSARATATTAAYRRPESPGRKGGHISRRSI